MQQPTCTNVRIRSTHDAHKIFAAVQKGILHMVTRRLDADERLVLRSGCIYAWEERGPHSELTGLGIERFTEGRRWSPSRVRDEFLFYYEKYSPPADANHNLIGNSPDRQPQPPRDWDPLVKQTYSVWVQTDKGRRKWHLTAYFTQTTIDQLGTIDDNPQLRDIVVEDGMFKSTRVGKSRSKNDDNNRSDGGSKAPSSSISRTYAPFPTPYHYQQQHDQGNTTPVLMHEPYQTRPMDQPSPGYEHTPSPILHPAPGPYQANHTQYSGSSTSSPPAPYVGYGINPNTMSPTSTGSHTTHAPNYQMTTVQHPDPDQSYYSPTASHLPWEGPNNVNLYPRAEPYHSPNGSANVKSPSFPVSSNYRPNTANHLPISPHAPYTPPHATGHLSGPVNPVYSPSYSLHAALALPSSEATAMPVDPRGIQLSPLHIPDRMATGSGSSLHSHSHSNLPHGPLGCGEVPMDAVGEEVGSESGLRALPLLRPPAIKYVRDIQDEKILRRLRERKSNT